MIFLLISLLLLIVGVTLFLIMQKRKQRLGSMKHTMLYKDNDVHPGTVLYAKTIKLKGKPDAIIKTKGGIIPLEIKTGAVPKEPRPHHVMQLMAYCYLIEEHYKKRPVGGILRYSQTGTEFKIGYTDEAKKSVEKVVDDILDAKKHKYSFTCHHPSHN